MMRRSLFTAGLMTMMLSCFVASGAFAVDDGGGRSVFARGAGERALALGGAYGAVANGPDAMIWNPAGLARLQRKNLYASHSSLIGMGFSEQLGLFGLPSWKLGNFGVGLRRFGVDGIEGRDAGGTIFADNLEDSETEILLGYGRNFAGAWDFGAVFKYQQHSLAGYSDGAPGIDLGVMVKPLVAAGSSKDWAEDFSLGLAIRNLIEPNLRLDEDGVKDPTGLRLGLAFDRQISRNLRLLVASDLEKTRDMDPRLHAGAELCLMDLLSLRLGSNNGVMAAGAGVRYSTLAFDYAFEDNVLETVHRFGLGMAFGPTNQEQRQASLAAQEAQLQKQLAVAFQRENQDRVREILAQARRDLAEGNHSEALNRLETCKVLQPGIEGLAELETEAYLAQGIHLEEQGKRAEAALAFRRSLNADPGNAQAGRMLVEVNRRSDQLAARSQQIRQLFDRALEAYSQEDLVSARDGFLRILDLNPDDREAAALLENTNQTLALRARALAEQARALALTGNISGARRTLAEGRVLDPNNMDLDAAKTAVDRREREMAQEARRTQAKALAQAEQDNAPPVSEATSAQVQKPTFAALSAKDQREVGELYQRGLQALEQGRNAEAVRYWELVHAKAPDYQQVADNLKREYLVEGMEAFAAGQLERSISVWEKAQTLAPDDPRTNGYLARAYEHKARIREIKGDN